MGRCAHCGNCAASNRRTRAASVCTSSSCILRAVISTFHVVSLTPALPGRRPPVRPNLFEGLRVAQNSKVSQTSEFSMPPAPCRTACRRPGVPRPSQAIVRLSTSTCFNRFRVTAAPAPQSPSCISLIRGTQSDSIRQQFIPPEPPVTGTRHTARRRRRTGAPGFPGRRGSADCNRRRSPPALSQ
jgi:hypothetical protein